MNQPTARLKRLNDRYRRARNADVLRMQAAIGQWLDRLRRRIIGELADVEQDREAAMRAFRAEVQNVPAEAADVMARGLREMWRRSWRQATANWMRAVPLRAWLRPLMPALLTPIEGVIGEAAPVPLDVEQDLLDIINGRITGEEAREIVRRVEFPPPSRETVDAVLNATSADDHRSAMERIRTVTERQLGALQEQLSVGIAEGEGLSGLSKRVRVFVDDVNYKAVRIARTEGVRIAEAAQRESWKAADELIDGIQVISAHVPSSRPEHIEKEGVYRKTGGGYVRDDGTPLPEIPMGPNCLCWSTPVLVDELEKAV